MNKEIKQAKKSDGYLIMITRRNEERLTHTFFTKNFRNADISKTLDEHKRQLESLTSEQNRV